MLSAPARPTCRHSLGKDGESAEGTGVGRVCPWFLTALLPAGIESPTSRPRELGERQQKAIDSADPSIWGLLLTAGLRGSARAVLRQESALTHGFVKARSKAVVGGFWFNSRARPLLCAGHRARIGASPEGAPRALCPDMASLPPWRVEWALGTPPTAPPGWMASAKPFPFRKSLGILGCWAWGSYTHSSGHASVEPLTSVLQGVDTLLQRQRVSPGPRSSCRRPEPTVDRRPAVGILTEQDPTCCCLIPKGGTTHVVTYPGGPSES